MLSRTRGSHAKENATGTPKHRHSLRNGLRLIRDLPGVPGLLASVTCEFITRKLDPSVGGPGPHDFAVRGTPSSPKGFAGLGRHSSVDAPRPSHPRATFVTIAIRPSGRHGMRQTIQVICASDKEKYFSPKALTRLLKISPSGKSVA